MKTERYKMFETNSSSVHSLTIDSSGMEPSNLPVKNGYVVVPFGEFDKSGDYTSHIDKLSYLVTQCYYLCGLDIPDRDNCYHFRQIEDAVCDYCDGVKGIKIKGGNPYIDHQSLPEYELNLVNEWDESSVQSFVFNKYITLTCSCD